MLSHILRQCTHTDASEVVDGEPGVAWIVLWKQALITRLEDRIVQMFLKLRHSQNLGEILKEDLDEYSTAGGRFLFIQVNHRQDVPTYCVGAKHMAKETCNITKSVRLITMNGIVIFRKGSFKKVGPKSV